MSHDWAESILASRVEIARTGLATTLGRLSIALTLASALLHPLAWTSFAGPSGAALLVAIAVCAAPVLAILGILLAQPRSIGQAELIVAGGALKVLVEGRVVWRAACQALRGGMLLPSPSGARVELHAATGDVLLCDVASRDAGQVVFAAARLDPGRRRLRVPSAASARILCWASLAAFVPLLVFRPLIERSVGWLGGSASEFLAAVVSSAWMLGLLGISLTIARVLTPPDITFGADGIVVHAWRSRFVAYARIRGIEQSARGCNLVLDDDARVPLDAFAQTHHDAIWAMILDAAKKKGLRPGGRGRLAILDRAGRNIASWRESLRALGERGTYREANVTRDELVGVIEDAAAPFERRVAAALLLGGNDADAGQRIRLAAAACASDALRVVLEKAADGQIDEAEVERALVETGAA